LSFDDNDTDIILTVVPEPGAMLLSILAGLTLALLRRRFRGAN
jgi:hypothetical protein